MSVWPAVETLNAGSRRRGRVKLHLRDERTNGRRTKRHVSN